MRTAAAAAKNVTPSVDGQQRLQAAARTHTLVIACGLGTTGTSALERALARLGLRTAKWGHVIERPFGHPMPSSVMDPLLQREPSFFALFNDVDAVLDSPAIDYLPALLDTYPRAALILTHRTARMWAERRAEKHPCSPPPFASWLGGGALEMSGRPRVCRRTPIATLEHAYMAWYAYVEAVARERSLPLLHLNLFAESDRQLWTKLIAFLERTTLVRPGTPMPRANRSIGRHLVGRPRLVGFGCQTGRVGAVAAICNSIPRSWRISMKKQASMERRDDKVWSQDWYHESKSRSGPGE